MRRLVPLQGLPKSSRYSLEKILPLQRACPQKGGLPFANMADIARLEEVARQVRRDALRMVNAVASGHPGGALGVANYLTALYFNVLNHKPKPFSMAGDGEDLFFLSAGHLSATWYSVLARAGYFDVEELATFRRLGARLQGHPSPHEGLPGVRIASGSLGQGLSVAVGAALGKRLRGDRALVYSLHGDGEMQEGQIWEAAMFAAARKVDNLIATVDCNNAQIDGPVEEVVSLGSLRQKFEAFGWLVVEANGDHMEALLKGLAQAKERLGAAKPVVLLMQTHMGHGVSYMEGDYRWHGKPPSDEQLATALQEIGETSLGDF